MLLEFLRFELRFWLRGMMLWVFFFADSSTPGGLLGPTR